MKKSFLSILALLLLATCFGWSQSGVMHAETAVWGTRTPATKPALAPELTKLGSGDPMVMDVIVQFSEVPTERHHQKVTHLGGSLKQELGVIKGAAYRMSADAIAALADDPEVVYISPDRTLKGSVDYSTAATNANMIFNWGVTGSGIGVAVIDSGVTAHADLQARL